MDVEPFKLDIFLSGIWEESIPSCLASFENLLFVCTNDGQILKYQVGDEILLVGRRGLGFGKKKIEKIHVVSSLRRIAIFSGIYYMIA